MGPDAMATFTHLWATIPFGSIVVPSLAFCMRSHLTAVFFIFYFCFFFFRWCFFQESGYIKFSSTPKQRDNTRICLVWSGLIACPSFRLTLSALLFQKGITVKSSCIHVQNSPYMEKWHNIKDYWSVKLSALVHMHHYLPCKIEQSIWSQVYFSQSN